MLLGAGFLASLNLAQAQSAVDSTQPEAGFQIMIPAMNLNGPVPSIAWAFNGITVNGVSVNITSVADLQTLLEALQGEPPVPFESAVAVYEIVSSTVVLASLNTSVSPVFESENAELKTEPAKPG